MISAHDNGSFQMKSVLTKSVLTQQICTRMEWVDVIIISDQLSSSSSALCYKINSLVNHNSPINNSIQIICHFDHILCLTKCFSFKNTLSQSEERKISIHQCVLVRIGYSYWAVFSLSLLCSNSSSVSSQETKFHAFELCNNSKTNSLEVERNLMWRKGHCQRKNDLDLWHLHIFLHL